LNWSTIADAELIPNPAADVLQENALSPDAPKIGMLPDTGQISERASIANRQSQIKKVFHNARLLLPANFFCVINVF